MLEEKQEVKDTATEQKAEVTEEVKVDESDKASSKKEDKKNLKVNELQKKLNETVSKNDELVKTNKELNEKCSELNDKYLRLAAEYDNFRRRSAKEKEDAYNYAYGEALNEFLPMVDNLERAVKYGAGDKVIDGVKMILSQFEQMLTKLGIETFGKVGEQFDPNIHNAVFHIEDENLEENVIAEVLTKGYKRGDKILRFAMVKVAN